MIALLVDHPGLIATTDADKAFWLLTDSRLRAMYSGAREGKSLHDLAPELLPAAMVPYVLFGRYVDHKDPSAALRAMADNLEARKATTERSKVLGSLADARRSGNRDKARLLSQLGVAERQGDHELAARLRESLAEHETGKQVD